MVFNYRGCYFGVGVLVLFRAFKAFKVNSV